MIYAKSNPVGIDKPIHFLQAFLYERLQSLWSLTVDQIVSFPRIDKINDELRFYYSGKDYIEKDFMLEDKNTVQFFFVAQDTRTFTIQWETPVDVYFQVNLQTVKPSITHRADEEVKQDIYNLLQQGSGSVVSIQPVDLKGFDEKMDMQPYHFFRFTINLKYRYDKTV